MGSRGGGLAGRPAVLWHWPPFPHARRDFSSTRFFHFLFSAVLGVCISAASASGSSLFRIPFNNRREKKEMIVRYPARWSEFSPVFVFSHFQRVKRVLFSHFQSATSSGASWLRVFFSTAFFPLRFPSKPRATKRRRFEASGVPSSAPVVPPRQSPGQPALSADFAGGGRQPEPLPRIKQI